ncbi:MAG TPA: DUF393 domain-containing protein [Marinagarivorans sp.]
MNKHQNTQRQHKTTVFFDSLCPICRREVAFYQTLDKPQHLVWIDLRALSSEQMAEQWGFTMADAMALLHVIDAKGQLHIGLAGHIVMWSQLPFYRVLAALLKRHPRLARRCDVAYQMFTRWRPGRFSAMQPAAGVCSPCRPSDTGSPAPGAQP